MTKAQVLHLHLHMHLHMYMHMHMHMHMLRLLLAASTSIRSQYVMVRKMKAIYHILNQFNQRDGGRVLIGECWMPTGDIPNIRCSLYWWLVSCLTVSLSLIHI